MPEVESDAYAVVAVFEFPDAVERQTLYSGAEEKCEALAALVERAVSTGERQIRYEGDRIDAPLHVLLAVCQEDAE